MTLVARALCYAELLQSRSTWTPSFQDEGLGFCKHDTLTLARGQPLSLQHSDLQAGALLLQRVLDHDALRQGVRHIVRLAGLLQQCGTCTCSTLATGATHQAQQELRNDHLSV